jgi:hypothetical protein
MPGQKRQRVWTWVWTAPVWTPPRGQGAPDLPHADCSKQQHHGCRGEDEHAGAAAKLPQRRLAERPIEGMGAGEARRDEDDAEHLHDKGTRARGFRKRDDDQRERRLLDEISWARIACANPTMSPSPASTRCGRG